MELHSVLLLVVLPCFLLSVRCADLEDVSDILKVPNSNTLEVEDKIGRESTPELSHLHEDDAVVQAPDEATTAVKSKCPNSAEVDSSAKDDSCRKLDPQPDENADVKQNEERQPLVAEDSGSEEVKADSQSDSNTDIEAGSENAKHVQSTTLVLEAFGTPSTEVEAEEGTTESPGEDSQTEEELWSEQTEEGSEQKRAGGRRFFSLMNLIKFLLNPVIEEFRVEKSTPSSDAPAPAAATATSTASTAAGASNSNGSDLADTPAANSSEVSESEEKKNGTDSGKKTKFQCVGRNVTENTTAAVRVVNSTALLELLSFDKNHTSSDCVLVMFYAPWCCFCAATAPNYNAVARAFPQLEVLAVDTVHFSNLNARFGTVAVPNIMLFHQSRSAVRFNHTNRNFQTLLQFITNTTGLDANSSVEVSTADFEGPLSSVPTEETDYLLWFAWLFIVVCSGYIFISSQAGQRAIERVNVLWQEHQHQHIE